MNDENMFLQDLIQKKEQLYALANTVPPQTDVQNVQILIPQISKAESGPALIYDVQKFYKQMNENFKQSSKKLREALEPFKLLDQQDLQQKLLTAVDDPIAQDQLIQEAKQKARLTCIDEVSEPIYLSINLKIIPEIIEKIFNEKRIMKWFFQNISTYDDQITAQYEMFIGIITSEWVKDFILEKARRPDSNVAKISDSLNIGCKANQIDDQIAKSRKVINNYQDGSAKKIQLQAYLDAKLKKRDQQQANQVQINKINEDLIRAMAKLKKPSKYSQKKELARRDNVYDYVPALVKKVKQDEDDELKFDANIEQNMNINLLRGIAEQQEQENDEYDEEFKQQEEQQKPIDIINTDNDFKVVRGRSKNKVSLPIQKQQKTKLQEKFENYTPKQKAALARAMQARKKNQ